MRPRAWRQSAWGQNVREVRAGGKTFRRRLDSPPGIGYNKV